MSITKARALRRYNANIEKWEGKVRAYHDFILTAVVKFVRHSGHSDPLDQILDLFEHYHREGYDDDVCLVKARDVVSELLSAPYAFWQHYHSESDMADGHLAVMTVYQKLVRALMRYYGYGWEASGQDALWPDVQPVPANCLINYRPPYLGSILTPAHTRYMV